MDFNQNQNQQPETQSQFKAIGAFLWDLVKIAIVALVIIVPFRYFIAQPFVVSGSSMEPDFHDRDYLIVDQISYRYSQPARGDVIVLKYPRDESQYFIKRIIGLPGDTVSCDQRGYVVITNKEHPQGVELTEPYLAKEGETGNCKAGVTLGSDEYFVFGDNREHSSDSRVWGILPSRDIVGKVWIRVFPFSDFGLFHRPSYGM